MKDSRVEESKAWTKHPGLRNSKLFKTSLRFLKKPTKIESRKAATIIKTKDSKQKFRASEDQPEAFENARKDKKQKGCHYNKDQRQQAGSLTITKINSIEVKPSQK